MPRPIGRSIQPACFYLFIFFQFVSYEDAEGDGRGRTYKGLHTVGFVPCRFCVPGCLLGAFDLRWACGYRLLQRFEGGLGSFDLRINLSAEAFHVAAEDGRLVVSYSAVYSKLLLVTSEIPHMIYQFGGVLTTPHILETAAKDLSLAPRTFSNALIIGLTAASASALFRLPASESSYQSFSNLCL